MRDNQLGCTTTYGPRRDAAKVNDMINAMTIDAAITIFILSCPRLIYTVRRTGVMLQLRHKCCHLTSSHPYQELVIGRDCPLLVSGKRKNINKKAQPCLWPE